MQVVKVFENIKTFERMADCLQQSETFNCKAVVFIAEVDFIAGLEGEQSEQVLNLLKKIQVLTVLVVNGCFSKRCLPFFNLFDFCMATEETKIKADAEFLESQQAVRCFMGRQKMDEKDKQVCWNADILKKYGIVNHILKSSDRNEEVCSYFKVFLEPLKTEQICAIKKCFEGYKSDKPVQSRLELVEEEMRQFCMLSEERYKEIVG